MYLLTPGRDRKADVRGVATMVKAKEQLNNVGNNAVPAADINRKLSIDAQIELLAQKAAYQVLGLLHHAEAATENTTPMTANITRAL